MRDRDEIMCGKGLRNTYTELIASSAANPAQIRRQITAHDMLILCVNRRVMSAGCFLLSAAVTRNTLSDAGNSRRKRIPKRNF